ncbi:MAG: creatininase family protein [Candidatus Bathyarchaeia archaeon]
MNNQVWFAELTMQEVKEAAKADKVIIIPFGSVEEHGSHLPLCTKQHTTRICGCRADEVLA